MELDYVGTDGRTLALTAKVPRLGTAYLSGLRRPAVDQELYAIAATVGDTSGAVVAALNIAASSSSSGIDKMVADSFTHLLETDRLVT